MVDVKEIKSRWPHLMSTKIEHHRCFIDVHDLLDVLAGHEKELEEACRLREALRAVKLPPSEWEKIKAIKILDPDGWRVDCKGYDEPITGDEWDQRMASSTIMASQSVFTTGRCQHGAQLAALREELRCSKEIQDGNFPIKGV